MSKSDEQTDERNWKINEMDKQLIEWYKKIKKTNLVK